MTSASEPRPASGRPTPSQVALHADQITIKLLSISTDGLRAQTAGAEIQALSPVLAALVLGVLLRRGSASNRSASVVTAIDRALSRGELDAEFVAATLACARSRADRLVEALLAAGPAVREYDINHEHFVDRRMRAMTLGQRRALSKSRDIDLLLRLAHDQDPLVIRQLLLNPRITEREAVLIASRRPTHGHVLEAVLRSRFGNSRRVRRAVAHNPYSSVAQAVRALATLTAAELRLIIQDEHVSPEVRQHARSLVVAHRATPAERNAAPVPPLDQDAESWIQQLEADVGLPAEDIEIEAMAADGRSTAS